MKLTGCVINRIKLEKIRLKAYEWTQTTTGHGVPQLFRHDQIPILRAIWLVCVIGSATMCCVLFVSAIVVYFQYEVTTQLQQIDSSVVGIEFPMVSFCTLNQFSSQRGINYVLDKVRSVYGPNVSTLSDIYAKNGSKSFFELLYFLKLNAFSMKDPEKRSLGLTVEEIMIDCHYNSVPCNLTELEWYYSIDHGNCYRFNSGKDKYGRDYPLARSRLMGYEHGLRVQLIADLPRKNASELLDILNPTSGVYLVISNQSYIPLGLNGFGVSTTQCTRVELTKSIITNLPAPYSNCVHNVPDRSDQQLSDDEVFINKAFKALATGYHYAYTQASCLKFCLQIYGIYECCPKVDEITLRAILNGEFISTHNCSSQTNLVCLQGYLFNGGNSSLAGLKKCLPFCPTQCERTEFGFDKSSVKFPSQSYEQHLITNNVITGLFNKYNIPITEENIQQSVSCFEVFYNNLAYVNINQQPTMTLLSLVSNLGGSIGLLTGCSLLSAIEILDFVVGLVTILIKRTRTVENT